jgi:DNA polymerase III subunit epsilon
MENLRILDTETTGLNRDGSDRIVEIAIINSAGNALLNTLVNPEMPIPAEATAIHGITDEMVADSPTLDTLTSQLTEILSGKTIIIYNAGYDVSFLPESVISSAAEIKCCMDRFSPIYGEWNEYHGNYKWQTLTTAAKHVGHEWHGDSHRALADCLATLSVWRWLNDMETLTMRCLIALHSFSLEVAE